MAATPREHFEETLRRATAGEQDALAALPAAVQAYMVDAFTAPQPIAGLQRVEPQRAPGSALGMIAEWRKGCSCAPPGKPEQCHECTRGLIDALERRLSGDPMVRGDWRPAGFV